MISPRRRVFLIVASTICSLSVLTAQRNTDSRDGTEQVNVVLAALQAEPGKMIADVGSGDGFYSIRIAQAVTPAGRVTAVDVDEKILDTLRKRLANDKIDNVDVDLIRFGGHLLKGRYDVPNGGNEKPTAPSAVHG
jgi:predicted O-methyltransferase YrrM